MNEHTNITGVPALASVAGGQEVTMSSREIAELTGKRHDHVMRDIKIMLEELGTSAPSFGGSYVGDNGKQLPCFNLPKRESLILVSGYSIELRARIIDRWQELETAVAARPVLDFSDPKVMLGVFNHLQEQVQAKEVIIEEQGERLKKLDRLERAYGSMCISDAAKTLNVQRNQLFAVMSARRWIFKRAGSKSWLAYDDIRKAGLMEHDDHLYLDGEGRERIATRALVTAKGLVKLAAILEEPLH